MHLRVYAIFVGVLFSIFLVACGGSTSTATSSPVNTSTTPQSQGTPTTSGTVCATPGATENAYNIVSKQSEASYSVQEQFLNRDLPNQAIGKTNNIQGSFLLNTAQPSTISSLTMTVDLRTLTSDQSRRDDAIKGNWLQSNTYPFATFSAKSVQASPDVASDGMQVSFDMPGNMTIRQVTRPETFHVSGKLAGDTISGKATTNVLMKNYGFDAPDIAGLLKVKDGVALTLNFTAQKGPCAQGLS